MRSISAKWWVVTSRKLGIRVGKQKAERRGQKAKGREFIAPCLLSAARAYCLPSYNNPNSLARATACVRL